MSDMRDKMPLRRVVRQASHTLPGNRRIRPEVRAGVQPHMIYLNPIASFPAGKERVGCPTQAHSVSRPIRIRTPIRYRGSFGQ